MAFLSVICSHGVAGVCFGCPSLQKMLTDVTLNQFAVFNLLINDI